MSRILEALRRAETERETRDGVAAEEHAGPFKISALPELLGATQRQFPATPQFPPLTYHDNQEHFRTGNLNPDSHVAAERFRQLRYRLEAWRARQPDGRLLITSAVPGEGKTLVATNLAESLAAASARVLLIDADMRRPGVGPSLGLDPLPGLCEILRGELNWREGCRRLEPLGYDYLAAGVATDNAPELLHGGALQALMTEVAAAFDWVVIDSAPLAPFADSLYLASVIRGILLVARERVTPADVFQKVVNSLREFPLIGIVLNAVQRQQRDSYYYAYYYGERGADSKPEPLAEVGNGDD